MRFKAACCQYEQWMYKMAVRLGEFVNDMLQVFVANPNKTPEIVEVLSSNKEKLLKYLGDFHTDKGGPITFCLGLRTSTAELPI